MRRNLDRRIETLVPVERQPWIDYLRSVLDSYIEDDANSWNLDSTGEYARANADGKRIAQSELIAFPATHQVPVD
jgi:polyphosphate kinase